MDAVSPVRDPIPPPEIRTDLSTDGLLLQVFSAPNYVDTSGNKGAYINIGPEYKLQHNTFDAVEHPPIKAMAYAQSPLMSMM